MKVLIVVDMQNDFVGGSLGSASAWAIVPNVMDKIKSFDGKIVFTRDTHGSDYLETNEGKNLPVPHCIVGTLGWELVDDIRRFLKEHDLEYDNYLTFNKCTFGDISLAEFVDFHTYYYDSAEPTEIELVGLCTDICVVSNALILKAAFPEAEISVDASCCAGTTPEKHEAALKTMESCQIKILNWDN